jgi:hypothetical protein
MKLDDDYMFTLSLRVSDYEEAARLYKKAKSAQSEKNYHFLALYCKDLRIYNMFNKTKLNTYEHLFSLIKNPYDNSQIIKKCLVEKKVNPCEYWNGDSLILNLIRSKNSVKKIKILEYLLNEMSFDFNRKNSASQTNSQILLNENPTDLDSVFIEKIEKKTNMKNSDNSYLFTKNLDFFSGINLESEIKKFVKSPLDSLKINFCDVELDLLRLNLKLRKMYDFQINKLNHNEELQEMNEIHLKILNTFLTDKILLEKI